MINEKKKIVLLLRKPSAWILILIALLFVTAISAMFVKEKQKLDREFETMITGSLNIHTEKDAAQIDKEIRDAGRALKMAETIFRLMGNRTPEEFLKQRNASSPVYVVDYVSMEDIQANPSTFFAENNQKEALSKLMNGETVVGDVCYDQSQGVFSLAVILPLREGEVVTGALYTRLKAVDLLHTNAESAVYQDVKTCLVTGDGTILFNTYDESKGHSLMTDLNSYGLKPEEIQRIADIISSPEVDSAIFHRHKEAYYASAAQLQHNGWSLVSFVRGPDVLMHSTSIFQEVVRTSLIAILITAAAIYVVFLQLHSSKKKLREEEARNLVLTKRFKAMFDQHSALKVVFDPVTGEIVDANPAILRYFGFTKEELVGRSVQDFNLLPLEVQNEKMQGEISSRALYHAAPHRLKNGETKFLDVYASAIQDGGRRLLYAILFDVTEREHYREELLKEKELLRITLQSIGDGVVTTDNQGLITSMNSIAKKMTGWEADTAVGKSFTEVFVLQNEDTGKPVENPIQKVLETGRAVGLANHTELKNRQGGRIPIADSAAPIKSEDGETFGVVMVFRDVGDEKKHGREIEFLSYHDSLTGLYNRRYIEETMARPDAADHLPISVIMADVNGLKITNDVFGHKAGDSLLRNVADLMQKCCQERDLIARWGGDEFVILMPETELETAEAVIQRMKDTRVEIESSGLLLSLSLGCACKETAAASIQTAMQQAEENMYQQKLLDGKSYRNAVISTLLATLYEKSNETEEHSKRLEKYCHAIGTELQLSSRELDDLSLLALLHDIGKVGVHPNILKKPGPLTPAEWDEMKRHPEIGYRIAQATPELSAVSDLILSHHERWDGEGYPRKLKGEEIPLACRILSVVDAFDAMTNDRIYRPAMTMEESIREIQEHAGEQFDPQAARILIGIIKKEIAINVVTTPS